MKYLLRAFLFTLLFFSITRLSYAAVILQYHHVSSSTPASTSISPKQFEVHLQYLHDNNFKVVPLSELVDNIKNKKPLADKTVAITFDDAYIDVLTNGKPILDKFSYPYTIYVNPGIINRNETNTKSHYLSWTQLKALAEDGVIIANHGYEHDSMSRTPDSLTQKEWLQKQTDLLLKAEAQIKEHTGQSWKYFAYPYGEYDVAVQNWAKKNDFVAFSQQSGAIDLSTDLTSVPRFPASKPYDKISSLRDKLNSLAFNIRLAGDQAETTFKHKEVKSITFDIESTDFYKSALNCYISGLGKQKINWHDDKRFSIEFSKDLPVGRVRANCTAASISKPGRYYWYSKPWFVLKEDGSWYHL